MKLTDQIAKMSSSKFIVNYNMKLIRQLKLLKVYLTLNLTLIMLLLLPRTAGSTGVEHTRGWVVSVDKA